MPTPKNLKQKNELLSINGITPRFALAVPKPTPRLGRVVANHYIKIAGAVCSALIVFVQLSNIGSTISYFSDVESSSGNYFVADPLYFTVAPATTTLEVGAADQLLVPVMTLGEGSDKVQYSIASQMIAGDAALCGGLHVLGTAPFPYDGPLLGLSTGFTTDTGPWALTLSMSAGTTIAADTSCTVDLIYTGWNASSTPGQGYTDQQKISLTFMYTQAPPAAGGPSAAPTELLDTTEATSTTPDATTTSSDQMASPSVDTITPPTVTPPDVPTQPPPDTPNSQ